VTTPRRTGGDTDAAADAKRLISEQIGQVARQYLDHQRSRPGATGRSVDGSVEVALNGLGDVTAVTVRAPGLPEETATRLALAFQQAWTDAGRQVALATAQNTPLADQPGVAELVQEQISERYRQPDPPEQERPAARAAGDEDFGEQPIMRRR
jgi:DNA-binding protein YbaB